MSVRVFNAPPGLDYDPVRGLHRDISFGVVRASEGSAPSTLEGVIAKRLFPWGPPDCREIDWSKATAKPWEILLPPAAPSSLWEAAALLRCLPFRRRRPNSGSGSRRHNPLA